jgi:hypothetical protein
MVHAATPFAVHRLVSRLPWPGHEGIVKDHHQVLCAQRFAAVMTDGDGVLALIVALGAFPAHYRVILPH